MSECIPIYYTTKANTLITLYEISGIFEYILKRYPTVHTTATPIALTISIPLTDI